MHRDAAVAYRDIQRNAAHIFLDQVLSDPGELCRHIRFNFAATVLKIMYGIEAQEKDDHALEAVLDTLIPGRWVVEYVPALRHVPAWVPGMRTQHERWAKWQAASARLVNLPYSFLVAERNRPEVQQSVVNRLLVEREEQYAGDQFGRLDADDKIEVAKNVGAIGSTLQAVFLALSLHPDIMAKAHAELDAVVGPRRMPDFDDAEPLLYVRAFILESLRWHNVTPLGVPHATVADDIWRGWFIPADTLVIPNAWACMHDPNVYPEPFMFKPERFIKDGQIDTSVPDPTDVVFGFGRRICPGRHLARAALFINVASIMHVFNITPPLDENGKAIKVEAKFSDGFFSYPEDTRCTIKARSPAHERLIRENAEAARAMRG
ncbi:cytochrome P450 [Epithele typhae]|uniref:cytochrome P450 n=1 Tax=Epithele typhae TaxID=378194 RepID=UPI00200887C2|nr:cytochrome P450 [Epithele typhae]KAH9929093.1 cytochrome P450 [Epithele typhae]